MVSPRISPKVMTGPHPSVVVRGQGGDTTHETGTMSMGASSGVATGQVGAR
jgi:hypothetical protein